LRTAADRVAPRRVAVFALLDLAAPFADRLRLLLAVAFFVPRRAAEERVRELAADRLAADRLADERFDAGRFAFAGARFAVERFAAAGARFTADRRAACFFAAARFATSRPPV
jgi:hypothetical protein